MSQATKKPGRASTRSTATGDQSRAPRKDASVGHRGAAGTGHKLEQLHVIFAISALLALALMFALGWRELHKDWRRVQRQHPAWRQGVVQIVGQAGVDRCATCHQDLLSAATDTRHSPKMLKYHAPRVMGCLVCHGGDGRALDRVKAHHAHGALAVLGKNELNTACVRCHVPGSLAQTRPFVRGLQVFAALGCASCHRLGPARAAADAQGGVGPDLDNIGLWKRADLELALRDPKRAFGPKTEMPSFAGFLQRDKAGARALFFFLRAQRADLPILRARADSGQPCIGCHALQPARGFARHRCAWIKQHTQSWRCARCHDADFLQNPGHGQAQCTYIDAQRATCVYCHQPAQRGARAL